ncbi:hypothetical protein CPB85DRAFT_1255357 [Mucidula mucida]|nr:hypothetical protein CPB85DRAFT_1255357 [Mucidula mucida]
MTRIMQWIGLVATYATQALLRVKESLTRVLSQVALDNIGIAELTVDELSLPSKQLRGDTAADSREKHTAISDGDDITGSCIASGILNHEDYAGACQRYMLYGGHMAKNSERAYEFQLRGNNSRLPKDDGSTALGGESLLVSEGKEPYGTLMKIASTRT